jgi:hypothetical protein
MKKLKKNDGLARSDDRAPLRFRQKTSVSGTRERFSERPLGETAIFAGFFILLSMADIWES